MTPFPCPRAARRDLGTDGLPERCSCPLSTKPFIRARRWEGGELLYKQSFKINCFSSLEQELAFQPRDTIRVCSDCIFSGALYRQGCLAGAGWSFWEKWTRLASAPVLLGLETNGSDYCVFTTTNGVFVSHHFSSPQILCCESVFTLSSCLSWSVAACCALNLLINPIYFIGQFMCLKFWSCQHWCLSYESCNIQCFL